MIFVIEKNTNEEIKMADNKIFEIMQSFQWAQSVIYQGNRVFIYFDLEASKADKKREYFEEIEKTQNFDLLSLLSQPTNDIEIEPFIRIMEEHFFVIALGKSIDYFKKFNEYDKIIHEIDNLFSLKKIADLRNMREHDDEYVSGAGHAQSRFNFNNVSKNYTGDMTATYCTPSEYYLGNVEIRGIVNYYTNKLANIHNIYKCVFDSLVK